MLKVKSTLSSRLGAYVNGFGSDVFTTGGTILLCKMCNIKMAAEKKITIQQHILKEKIFESIEIDKNKKWKTPITFKYFNQW